MPIITIQNTPINFPDTSASPNWAPAVIQFAQLVEAALNTVSSGFDIPPQVFNIDSYNPGSNIDIINLAFPVSNVRSFIVYYAVYRTTSINIAYEAGSITAVYNPGNSPGYKWEFNQHRVGDGKITFNVDDDGQVTFTTDALSGANHAGSISFNAKALTQT